MNRNLNHISSRMIDDYKERREKYDCNPERMTRARTQIEQTLDWYDASVSIKNRFDLYERTCIRTFFPRNFILTTNNLLKFLIKTFTESIDYQAPNTSNLKILFCLKMRLRQKLKTKIKPDWATYHLLWGVWNHLENELKTFYNVPKHNVPDRKQFLVWFTT